MATQKINFASIVRNLPDNNVPDGSMLELINLRPGDGALRPVGRKTGNTSLPQNVIYIHRINSNTKIYLGHALTDFYIASWVYVNNELISSNSECFAVGSGHSIECIGFGNVLVVINHTDQTRNYLVFNPSSCTYRSVGDSIPDIPSLTISSTDKHLEDPKNWKAVAVEDNAESVLAAALKIMNETGSTETGWCTGHILVRFAWEMVDGSVVKHTIPMDVSASTFQMDVVATTLDWRGFELAVVPGDVPTLTAIKIGFKGIISSLNVYVSRMQEFVAASYRTGLGWVPQGKTIPVEDITEYYKIATIPLDNIDGDALTKGLYGPYYNLVGRSVLNTDNFTHHLLYSKTVFNYNQRLFLGDVLNKLSENKGVFSSFAAPAVHDHGAEWSLGFEFDIETKDGTKTVFTGWRIYDSYVGGFPKVVNLCKQGIIGYPDDRARTCRIYTKLFNETRLDVTLGMIPNHLLNFAYCRAYSVVIDSGGSIQNITANPIRTYRDENRVQACELSNPFYYPAINSYRIGDGEILGMASNAIALSQGQFGQFPIFCFTTDGIWTMNIGTGETLINTITPLSRHVCNNPASITPIDGGVVFSTTKGLYILSGNIPIEISQAAEGRQKGGITGSAAYDSLMNNPNRYQVKDYLCAVSFLTYIAGAKIAWDYANKEIIVSNSNYKYSWVYSLEYKSWFKISQVFSSLANDYPIMYGYHTVDNVYTKFNLGEETFSTLVPVHLETRPIKLPLRGYKKLLRLLLSGLVNDASESAFQVNLFGSPDNNNWYLLNNGKSFVSREGLVIGRASFSCQSFILVAGGNVDELSYFTHAEMDYEDRYGSKLR